LGVGDVEQKIDRTPGPFGSEKHACPSDDCLGKAEGRDSRGCVDDRWRTISSLYAGRHARYWRGVPTKHEGYVEKNRFVCVWLGKLEGDVRPILAIKVRGTPAAHLSGVHTDWCYRRRTIGNGRRT
jgi:hypothetical protein